jgi:hypothetical protein
MAIWLCFACLAAEFFGLKTSNYYPDGKKNLAKS